MITFKCDRCGYEDIESKFLSGECPACCCNTITGEYNRSSIPSVFHEGAFKVWDDENGRS